MKQESQASKSNTAHFDIEEDARSYLNINASISRIAWGKVCIQGYIYPVAM
jgi:hypothetical protein